MPRFVALIALVCLFWQAMAFAGTLGGFTSHGDDSHRLQAVHHDDVGAEPTGHALSDGPAFPEVLANGHPRAVQVTASSLLVPFVPHFVGTALIGGIERPPRAPI